MILKELEQLPFCEPVNLRCQLYNHDVKCSCCLCSRDL